MEASDDLFVRMMPGVFRIEVHAPPGVHTLKFLDLSRLELEALYDRGYAAASQRFARWDRLNVSKEAGGALQRQLWAIYGDQKLFEPALFALARMIEDRTNAKGIRSQVMLPTGRPDGKRIVTYHYGFLRKNSDTALDELDSDHDLELAEYGGCTGRALKERGPAFADLEEAAKGTYETWDMELGEQSKVSKDRKSMLSVPIFAWSRDRNPDLAEYPTIGVLSVDSSTRLCDTGWLEPVANNLGPGLRREVFAIMTPWADIISKLLR